MPSLKGPQKASLKERLSFEKGVTALHLKATISFVLICLNQCGSCCMYIWKYITAQ